MEGHLSPSLALHTLGEEVVPIGSPASCTHLTLREQRLWLQPCQMLLAEQLC